MRFNFAKILVAISVASVAARPTLDLAVESRDVAVPVNQLQERAVITDITPLVREVLKALKLDNLPDPLSRLLNGQLGKTIDQLGLTFALTQLKLSNKPTPPKGDLQAIGAAVSDLLRGLKIDDVNARLNRATGGAINNLSKALGVDDVLKALGITGILGARV